MSLKLTKITCNVPLCTGHVKNASLPVQASILYSRTHLNTLHLFVFQDGVMVLSATHRYKKKYVTTLLYKPI